MATLQRQSRPNGHAHKVERTIDTMQCPTCASPISAEKFAEIQGTLHAHDAEIERAIETRFVREIARMEAGQKAEIEKARKQGGMVASKKLELLRASQETIIAARIATEREAGAKRLDEAIRAAKLEHSAEKLRLEAITADLTRRLQAKPADAIGAPAKKSLFEQIQAALAEIGPDDVVRRVGRGIRGADVVVEVTVSGEIAGTVLIESKAHSRWQSSFTQKLREDQIREGATFAILSTNVLWSGAPEQIALRDGVVCARPERVPTLVTLFRKIIADNFLQRLGAEQRNSKADRVYDFILSPRCDDLFDTLLRLTRDLEAVDANEMKAHQTIWTKRAELVKGINAVRAQFVGVVADIIGGGR